MIELPIDATRHCPCRVVDNLDDTLFEPLPITWLPIRELTLSQPRLDIERVLSMSPKKLRKPVRVVRHGDVLHLVNGHHRVVRLLLAGFTRVRVRVLERDLEQAS